MIEEAGPLDSQLLEPIPIHIPLIQEGVHVLFHSLDAQFVLPAFYVVLFLLGEHVRNYIVHLL